MIDVNTAIARVLPMETTSVTAKGGRVEFLHHLLRVSGLHPASREMVLVLDSPGQADLARVKEVAERGGLVVAVMPCKEFTVDMGVEQTYQPGIPKIKYSFSFRSGASVILRTLHACIYYAGHDLEKILSDDEGHPLWVYRPLGIGGVLILGTALIDDLCRYRQGDPVRALERPVEQLWGFAGERPNYLFESQLPEGASKYERQADYWMFAFAETIGKKLGRPLKPVLPNAAPGAVVITGDDDQAALQKYEEQLKLLGDMPITYLLHPLTHHTPQTLKSMQIRNPGVDFGIHPDALETPSDYGRIFDEQVSWYKNLTGSSPISVRNHGFLNDGYWGHLETWLGHEVKISSNLPGLDGRVLNGSLLPARMVWKGKLTNHWSVLTAIGDGIRFVSGMSDKQAADRVWEVADRIQTSGLPGVMVLNLHPQNVSETRAMHVAAMEIIRSGFVGWNLRQCYEWFDSRDRDSAPSKPTIGSRITEQWKTLIRQIRPH